MTNVIEAHQLNEEIVANLPKEVVDYFAHAQFKVNFSFTDTPSEGCILALNEGDLIVVRTSGALGRTVIGEVDNKSDKTVRVKIDADSTHPQFIKFDEYGREFRAMDSHYAQAWAYDEYNFNQHIAVNKYLAKEEARREKVIASLEQTLANNPQLVRLLTTEDAEALLNQLWKA